MRWMLSILIAFTGCTMTIKPVPPEKKVVYRTRTKVVHAEPKKTPVPKLTDNPPYPPSKSPPPNYDEILRRTHPSPTISPEDFQ